MWALTQRQKFLAVFSSVIVVLLLAVHPLRAQILTTTVSAGTDPRAVAVNPLTNKIYVANSGSNTVTVIDGATNTTTTVADPNATAPSAVAVNPVTNQVYVANNGSANVTVIDGATNGTATVSAGSAPVAVAVNPVTNKIYVADYGSAQVTVIDGATNTIDATVPAGTNADSVAVNPLTNKIYVANSGSANVTVIDGATNATTTVGTGNLPWAVAVNPVTNKIYVANSGSANVTVIDGATNATTTVSTGNGPQAVAVNPVTNKIYVADYGSAQVTVINGATNTVSATVGAGSLPVAAAVNPVTNKIYVANNGSANVTVIDGATNATTTVGAEYDPVAVAVNPVTNKIYVATDGVAVNPVTNKIYVINPGSNNVTVIDGATNTTTTVSAAGGVTVIDGTTNSTTTFAVGSDPVAVAVNPVTNKIYVTNAGSYNVTVIDGATNATTAVAVGGAPYAMAVNPATNKIYVASFSVFTVIDGATNSTTTLAVGSDPVAVAVNPVTNKIYVANYYSANVTVIDGATNSTTTVAVGFEPVAVAVNPVTNKIYVANYGSANVTVIDGATNATTTVGAGNAPWAVAVNPVTNNIYVANYVSNDVTVIDGATNATATVPAGTNADSVAVNPVTNQIYVVNWSGNVTVIDEQQVQPIPLKAEIRPLADKVTASFTPAFNFTASSNFSPFAPIPDNLLFQVDTWQGSWTAATNQGNGAFTGEVNSSLQPGIHILYAYSTDGQEATSTMGSSGNGAGTSPLISDITAYLFLVSPPTASLSATGSVSFGHQEIETRSAPQTVTLTNVGAGPLSIAGIAVSGDYSATSTCGSTLTAGASCRIDVTFTPGVIGPDNGTLTITDDSLGVNGSTQLVSLTGTGTATSVSVRPISLWLGNQAVDTTSAAKKVTVNNTGTIRLNFFNITINGTNSGDFAQTNNCTGSIAPGKSCIVNVTFTPTGTGTRNGVLTMTDDAYNSPQTVSLTGTGEAQVVWSPTSRGFGWQALGTTSAAKNVALTNNLSTALSTSGITFTGTNPGDFAQTNTCGSNVAAKSKCTISVTFTPQATGSRTATMNVNDSANNSPQTVSLTGTGEAQVVWSPTSLGFGWQALGTTSAAKNVTLTNNLSTALSISGITFIGTDPGDFAQTNTCGSSVAAKSKCTISVTFTPQATGSRAATMNVNDSANNSPQTVPLRGAGEAQVVWSPTSLSFAAQALGTTSAAQNVTLTNNLSTALSISGIAFSGTDPGDFAQTNTCGSSVAAKSECTISVTFTPQATGSRTATMNVNDSANNSPQTVTLTGTGK